MAGYGLWRHPPPPQYLRRPLPPPRQTEFTGDASDTLLGGDVASGALVFGRTASDSLLGGEITFDAVATFATNGWPAVNSFSFSHTIGGGPGRYIVVLISKSAGATPETFSSVTYNGVAMTEAAGAAATITEGGSATYHTEVWYLFGASVPAAGTYTVAGSGTGTAGGTLLVTCLSFAGAAQAAPEAATNTTVADDSSGSISTNITTLTASAWAVDVLQSAPGTGTAGGTQVERSDHTTGGPGGSAQQTSTLATTTAGSTAMAWSALGTGQRHAHSLVSIASGGDIATRLLVFARTATDALLGADTATRGVAFARTASDTLLGSDTATYRSVHPVGKIETLVDDFTTFGYPWDNDADTDASVTGGQLVLEPGGYVEGDDYQNPVLGVHIYDAWDLTESYIFCEFLPDDPNDAGGHQFGTFSLAGSGYAQFAVGNGDIAADVVVWGSNTTLATDTYSPTNHRWLRITLTGTTLNFDTSPDGTTWSNFATDTLDAGDLLEAAQVAPWFFNGSASDLIVDNVNNVPALVLDRTATDTLLGADTAFGVLYDPMNLTVDVSVPGVATLTWDASTTPGVTEYDIWRRIPTTGADFDPYSDTPVATEVAALTYDDTGLASGTYEWQVFGRVPV